MSRMPEHLETIDELNEIIRRGDFLEQVMRDESRHVTHIARIAERITTAVPIKRVVLVAGPSSAGKTTTAIRLCRAIGANGHDTLRLSTDDYFYGDAKTVLGADGQPDWETVEAIDRARLIADIRNLLAGGSVCLRRFDFVRHLGYDAAEPVRLPANGIIVLEGLHALNPLLTDALDAAVQFRVYINVFTVLAADRGMVYAPEDVRLMRRIVRDSATRNATASETLVRWPSVRAGEQTWINPFRHLSDAVFNTGLDYEIAVIRPYALDLLRSVGPADPGAREAARLGDILVQATETPSVDVPGDSILRETIGESVLNYA